MKQGNLSIYGLFCILFIFLVSCEKEPDIISESEPRTMLDVAYGTDDKQKMDVYLPANRSTEDTKVVVFIHGGAFFAGDRKDVPKSSIDYFLSKGWAVVNISYRLVNDDKLDDFLNQILTQDPPARIDSDIQIAHQVADVSVAVDHVLAHSREWAINGHRIGVAGHSAGGTLAILYAYSDYNQSGKVKAVGNWAGALDLAFTQADLDGAVLTKLFIPEFLHRISGHPFTPDNPTHLQVISPHYVVHAIKPIPIISIFPEHNVVLDLPRQDRQTYDRFTDRLNTLGIPNHFVQIDGADHGFGGDLTKRHVIDETVAYFNEYLK